MKVAILWIISVFNLAELSKLNKALYKGEESFCSFSLSKTSDKFWTSWSKLLWILISSNEIFVRLTILAAFLDSTSNSSQTCSKYFLWFAFNSFSRTRDFVKINEKEFFLSLNIFSTHNPFFTNSMLYPLVGGF